MQLLVCTVHATLTTCTCHLRPLSCRQNTPHGQHSVILLEFCQVFGKFKCHTPTERGNDWRISFNWKITGRQHSGQQNFRKFFTMFIFFIRYIAHTWQNLMGFFYFILPSFLLFHFIHKSFSFTIYKIQTPGRVPQFI